ncbi:MAG: type III-B CRISPR-associated protein Cas10/Cmr2, partial [Sulfolobales archaeon]
SLISELYQKNIDEKIINEIKKLAKEVVENYDPDEDVIPRYAVIPVTATFILPDIDVLKQFNDFRNIESLEDLKKLVENEYSRIWKDMYETIVENCSQLKNDLGKLAEKSKELLEKCRNYGFDQTPPFPIRVVAIHTDELYKIGFPTSEEEQYSLYHYMFKLLAYKESREKIYRFRPEENLKLYDMTSNPIESWKESKRGFDYCSLCGYLPAIIIMPSNEEEFKSESLDLRIEPIFSFGERLCPYCLIKRLLSISGILKPVMDKLLGKVSNKELHYIRFLSVTDIALIPFKFSIVNAVRRIDEAPDNVKDWFSKLVMKLFNEISSISGMRFDDLTRTREEAILHKEKKLLSMINKMKTDKLKGLLECLILLDSENGILGKSELRRVWKSFLENLRNGEGRHYVDFKMIHPINTYYAVVRCDADNFGKIIRGEIEEGFRVKIDHYLTDILEDEARDVVKALINGKYSEAKKLCEKEGISNIDGRLKELKEAIDRLIGRKEIIVSPSYHSALSRALISNAFRDIKNVERYGGLVVYAGGDDLLFVMPVSNCLNAVKDLKTDFSFPLLDLKGFHKVRKYYIPSLVTASRSFCIYLSHYMYPMYAIMNRSMKLLEETAKETKWMLDGVEEREKDALVFSYSSRGKEMTALLPLSDIRNPEENLGVSLKYVDDLINSIEMDSKFSASLIYDLNSCELIEPLIKQGNSLLLGKVIKNIFYRNCEIKDRDLRLRKAEENARNIMENYDLKFKVNNELRFYLKELVLSLKLYRSGLREAA